MEEEISLEAFMAGTPIDEAPKTISIEEFRRGSKLPKEAKTVKPVLSKSGVELSKKVGATYKAKALADPNATQAAAIPIPDAMQQEYDQFVASNQRGSIDPEEYAAFRLDQNKRFGFGAAPEDKDNYIAEAIKLNDLTRDANLRIPGAGIKELSAEEQSANQDAQSALGAGIIAAGDVASGNFLDEISGVSEQAIEENAANNPTASLLGTLAGGLMIPTSRGASLGTQALEGATAGAILGAGAAQDGNRAEGALLGGPLGAAGNVVAGKLLKALPEGVSTPTPTVTATQAAPKRSLPSNQSFYREASPDRAAEHFPTTPNYPHGVGGDRTYLADTKDLAKGQGKNTGVLLEYDKTSLVASPNIKPGQSPELAATGKEYLGNNSPEAYSKSLKSVTVSPERMDEAAKLSAKYDYAGRGLPSGFERDLADLEKAGWSRTIQADGSVRFEKPELGATAKNSKTPLTAADKLTKAIKEAGPIREEQTAAFKAARAEKFGKLAKAQEAGGGREAYINSLKAMKGELPKSDFDVVKKALTVDDVTELFDNISKAPISPGSRLSAHSGLEKLLDGKLPQPKELENLSGVFSPEFVKSVLSKRGDISKAGGVFSEAWNVTKSLQSTADISGLLRQGVGLIHRPEWWKSLGPMVKATFNTKQAAKFENQIKSDPLYDLANEADLSLTTTGKLGVNEDMFRSHLAEKIPVWGSVVRGSERSFVTFLNKLRFDTFKSLMNEAKDIGTDITDPEVAKGIANYINIMTGRGGLGSLKSATEALNNVFYSPGMISSRLQILAAPVQASVGKGFIAELPKGLRKEAAKSYASIIGLNTTALGLAGLAGNTVGLNPLSSEFLKAKDGDTRLDFGAGLTQYIVAGARAITRQSTSGGEKGTTRDLERAGDTPLDNDIRFVMNKMHPSLTLFLDQQRGKNTIGEPFKWQDALVARLTPMGFPDIAETLKEHGGLGAFYGFLGLLGAGLSNYKDSGASDAQAIEEFFKGTPVDKEGPLQQGEISLDDFYKGEEVE